MRPALPVLALASLALTSVGTGALARGQRAPATIGVDEIRPGMRGFGRTVFRGEEPERFDVEVIDVLRNFQPGQDLILVRTDHPILDRASTVAGMSGSPIYLDGRLAGAYAYGWPFGKDPVAGVTPIGNMLAELERPVRPDAFPGAELLARPGRPAAAPRHGPSPRLAGLPPYRGGAAGDALAPLAAHAARTAAGLPPGQGPAGLVPAATPLLLGGLGPEIAGLLERRLAPFGLVALQGGGAGAAPADPTGLPPTGYVAGGAIGVQLIRGDVAATAIGTVTHVGGRRLVAFGHPMMNAGETGLPTSKARVLHVLASEQRSFKIGEAGAPLGTLIHDRQAAIVVDSAVEAPTVPVTLRVRGVPDAPKSEWRMEVVSHRVLTPLLVFAAIGNALKATAADQTDVTFVARSRVDVAGHGTVELVDRGAVAGGPSDLGGLASLRLFSVMEAAYGNPFEESRVERVELDLDVTFGRDLVELVDASFGVDEVDPGSTVDLRVVTRRYGEAERVRIVSVHVPERAAGQELTVEVEAGGEADLEQPEPRDLDDLIGSIRRRLASTSIAVSTKLASRGLRFRGHVVQGLPASALDALQRAHDAGTVQPFVTVDRQVVDVGEVLSGKVRLALQVREHPRD